MEWKELLLKQNEQQSHRAKSVFKYLSFYLDKKLEFKGFTNFANTKLNTSC